MIQFLNEINRQKSEFYFLLILLIGFFVLLFLIFRPFTYSIILALVFFIVFNPFYKKIFFAFKGKRSLAALFTTIIVFAIIVAPFVFLGIQIFQEAVKLYSSLVIDNGNSTDFSLYLNEAIYKLNKFIPASAGFSIDVNQYSRQGLSWLIQHIGHFFANIMDVALGIIIFLMALYYLFKDGRGLKAPIIALSPLRDLYDEIVFDKLALAINSIIKGTLVVVFIQGVLTAIGLFVFGVPNAVLWGSVAAIAALIPGIGTSLVILPAAFYLFLNGKIFFMAGLLFWGVVAVGLIDNFLGPKLIGRGMRFHPFLILLSILGGIGLFGPLGFLLGPLILSLLLVFLEIYFEIIGKQKVKQNV